MANKANLKSDLQNRSNDNPADANEQIGNLDEDLANLTVNEREDQVQSELLPNGNEQLPPRSSDQSEPSDSGVPAVARVPIMTTSPQEKYKTKFYYCDEPLAGGGNCNFKGIEKEIEVHQEGVHKIKKHRCLVKDCPDGTRTVPISFATK